MDAPNSKLVTSRVRVVDRIVSAITVRTMAAGAKRAQRIWGTEGPGLGAGFRGRGGLLEGLLRGRGSLLKGLLRCCGGLLERLIGCCEGRHCSSRAWWVENRG